MTLAKPASAPIGLERLFFALWPEPALARRLYELAGTRLRAGDGRRVTSENIHLTLAFLGTVDAAFRDCAQRAAAAICAPSFTLILEQLGCWSRAGILWAAPARVPEPLLHLVGELTAGLSACGYVPPARPYAAHVTLARSVRGGRWFAQITPPLAWEVSRFCLARSHLDARGARYEVLRAWALSPPAA
jgi:2'-5' RNA ligase